MTERLAYTVDEASVALRVGRTTIYSLMDEQHLRKIKIGRRTLIPAEDIRRLIDSAQTVTRKFQD